MRRKGQGRPLAERFEAKIDRSGPVHPHLGTPCWLWRGKRSESRYAYISKEPPATGNIPAHRASWELFHGPIPDGLWVLHKCDVRSCVNPDHLFLGTNADNMRDMAEKGRARNPTADRLRAATHCPRGHEYTPENTRLYDGP